MLSTSILVLALVGVILGKIYLEENFDDDSFKERWVTPRYKNQGRKEFGEFERKSGQFECNSSNTGLRTMEDGHSYALSTQFTPFFIAHGTLVLQLSVKHEQKEFTFMCEDGYIKLFDCDFEPFKMKSDTPYFLFFGTFRCQLRLHINYLGHEHMSSTSIVINDGYTHIYTLILESDLTYRILLDGEEISKGGIVNEDQDIGSRDAIDILPPVCGIGLEIYNRLNGTIFDNILLTDDVAAAERKRKEMSAEIARCTKYSSVVDIASEDLEKIIDCKRNSGFMKDNQTRRYHILEDFYKFLVPFNWSGNNTIITATASYNKHSCISLKAIQLWVSFQPRDEDILVDIDQVLKIVNKANLMVSDTVTTIVINYGFLPLDNHTLTFVNYEVGKVRARLNLLAFQPPKLGLQISNVNCRSRNEYIKDLEIKLLDVLLITPMPHEKEFLAKNELDRKMVLLPCYPIGKLLKGKVTLFLHTHLSIDIDFEKGGYEFNDREFVNMFRRYNFVLPLMHAEDKLRDKDMVDTDTKQMSLSEDMISWLYRPAGFSKSHFGAVIDWDENKLLGSQNFAFFESFQKILIDVRKHDLASDDDDYLKLILQRIANYIVSTKKQESRGDHHSFQSPKDGIKIQMSILVTVHGTDFNFNKRQADKAISVAIKANDIFPGSVNAIFFDLLSCSRSKICTGYDKNSFKDNCSERRMIANLSNILDYANKTISKMDGNSAVSIGTIFDKEVTESEIARKHQECNVESYYMDQIGAILWKTIVRHEDIANFGGVKASQTVIENLSLCITISKAVPMSLSIYVNILGCAGTSSNMTLLFEFVRLMENLNKWATTENILLFTNAGAEMPSKCDENAEEEDCKCGWWMNHDDEYQDKKTIARQLYEEAEDIRRANDKKKAKTDMPKESRLWLWILIPAIVVAFLITACTGIIIYRYQVKYVLTKNEVKEFIKGRQTTRADPAKEGDETAEAQTYNSDKYELPPSTFTIDITSGCIGSGEFGRVYRGSIRRDGAVFETAVKMGNPSLVRKSHGYYLALKGLLSEIKILAYVGEHSHIVQLLGAYTKKVRKGEIAVFLELCQLGSLDKYLHSMKPQIVDDYELVNSTIESSPDTSDIGEEEFTGSLHMLDKNSSDDLYRWAGEIASGMEFLASKRLVHADLATRNVLLTGDKVAKISDFGLSRRLYDYTEYVKQNQAPLPWRWMAPESLCRMVFNEKSDIWAFGVTLWEMFTLGDMPYPGLTWQANFSGLLERGMRLPEPKYNVNEIYSIMLRCWNISPALRPTFSQLKSELNQI